MKLLPILLLTGISIVGSQRGGQLFCLHGFDGSVRVHCPKKSTTGRAYCITESQWCNGVADCPGGDDEKEDKCRFIKSVIQQHRDAGGRRGSALRQASLRAYSDGRPPGYKRVTCFECGWYCELRPEDRHRASHANVNCPSVDCSKCGRRNYG